jgi:hypothetical protein
VHHQSRFTVSVFPEENVDVEKGVWGIPAMRWKSIEKVVVDFQVTVSFRLTHGSFFAVDVQ